MYKRQHVDGFRFDLATALGRGDHSFERDGPFFKAVLQDPVLGPVSYTHLTLPTSDLV